MTNDSDPFTTVTTTQQSITMDYNGPSQRPDVNFSRMQHEDPSINWATIIALRDVIWYMALALGIPGNILSVIVWLRHFIAGKNSSVIYLAVLAIVNLVYLLSRFFCLYLFQSHMQALDGWLWYGANYIAGSAGILEPLLLLSFAVERLIAIRRPLQAQLYCTPDRAKKITASLLLVALTAQTVKDVIWFQGDVYRSITIIHIYLVVLNVVVPLTLLAINVTLVREVRRQSHATFAAHLGRDQRQHSTSSSTPFTIPTATLLTASLIYVLFCGTWFLLYYVYWLTQYAELSSTNKVGLLKVHLVADEAQSFVFSCIFYVYLVRRKQFRSDLYELFCQRRSAADTVATASVTETRGRHADTCL